MRVDNIRDVGQVSPSVRFTSNVERELGILLILLYQLYCTSMWIAMPSRTRAQTYLRDEKNKESINILSRCRTVIDISGISVTESDADGLIEEQHVGIVVP